MTDTAASYANASDSNIRYTSPRHLSIANANRVGEASDGDFYVARSPVSGCCLFERAFKVYEYDDIPIKLSLSLVFYLVVAVAVSIIPAFINDGEEIGGWIGMAIIVVVFQLFSVTVAVFVHFWTVNNFIASEHSLILWAFGHIGYGYDYSKKKFQIIAELLAPCSVHLLFFGILIGITFVTAGMQTSVRFALPMSTNLSSNVVNELWKSQAVLLWLHLLTPVYPFKIARVIASSMFATKTSKEIGRILMFPTVFYALALIGVGAAACAPYILFPGIWCLYQTFLWLAASKKKSVQLLPLFQVRDERFRVGMQSKHESEDVVDMAEHEFQAYRRSQMEHEKSARTLPLHENGASSTAAAAGHQHQHYDGDGDGMHHPHFGDNHVYGGHDDDEDDGNHLEMNGAVDETQDHNTQSLNPMFSVMAGAPPQHTGNYEMVPDTSPKYSAEEHDLHFDSRAEHDMQLSGPHEPPLQAAGVPMIRKRKKRKQRDDQGRVMYDDGGNVVYQYKYFDVPDPNYQPSYGTASPAYAGGAMQPQPQHAQIQPQSSPPPPSHAQQMETQDHMHDRMHDNPDQSQKPRNSDKQTQKEKHVKQFSISVTDEFHMDELLVDNDSSDEQDPDDDEYDVQGSPNEDDSSPQASLGVVQQKSNDTDDNDMPEAPPSNLRELRMSSMDEDDDEWVKRKSQQQFGFRKKSSKAVERPKSGFKNQARASLAINVRSEDGREKQLVTYADIGQQDNVNPLAFGLQKKASSAKNKKRKKKNKENTLSLAFTAKQEKKMKKKLRKQRMAQQQPQQQQQQQQNGISIQLGNIAEDSAESDQDAFRELDAEQIPGPPPMNDSTQSSDTVVFVPSFPPRTETVDTEDTMDMFVRTDTVHEEDRDQEDVAQQQLQQQTSISIPGPPAPFQPPTLMTGPDTPTGTQKMQIRLSTVADERGPGDDFKIAAAADQGMQPQRQLSTASSVGDSPVPDEAEHVAVVGEEEHEPEHQEEEEAEEAEEQPELANMDGQESNAYRRMEKAMLQQAQPTVQAQPEQFVVINEDDAGHGNAATHDPHNEKHAIRINTEQQYPQNEKKFEQDADHNQAQGHNMNSNMNSNMKHGGAHQSYQGNPTTNNSQHNSPPFGGQPSGDYSRGAKPLPNMHPRERGQNGPHVNRNMNGNSNQQHNQQQTLNQRPNSSNHGTQQYGHGQRGQYTGNQNYQRQGPPNQGLPNNNNNNNNHRNMNQTQTQPSSNWQIRPKQPQNAPPNSNTNANNRSAQNNNNAQAAVKKPDTPKKFGLFGRKKDDDDDSVRSFQPPLPSFPAAPQKKLPPNRSQPNAPAKKNNNGDGAGYGMMMAPPTRQQRQELKAKKAQKKKQPQSVWDVDENDVDDDDNDTWKKKGVLSQYPRKSMINEKISDDSIRRIDINEKRKSIFDESSSDSEEDDNNGRRLTVDVTNARNHSVSGHVNVNQYR